MLEILLDISHGRVFSGVPNSILDAFVLEELKNTWEVEFTRFNNIQMDSTNFSPNFRVLLEILNPKTRVQMYSNVEYLTREF